MKEHKTASVLFGLAGAGLIAATVLFCVLSIGKPPVLLSQPHAAAEQAEKFMAAVCRDDFTAAQQLLLGTPSLGSGEGHRDGVSAVIWDAYIGSIEYSFPGGCYASDNGIALDMHLRCLNISSITGSLRERSQTILDERAATEDKSTVYDANNNYREVFVMEALCDAAEQAIREDAAFDEQDLTLHMAYQDGQWWIMPEQALLGAVSGEPVQ